MESEIAWKEDVRSTISQTEWFYLDYLDLAPEYNIDLNSAEHLEGLDELVVKGSQSNDAKVRVPYKWLKQIVEAARKHQQSHPEDYVFL